MFLLVGFTTAFVLIINVKTLQKNDLLLRLTIRNLGIPSTVVH